jgi:hypothetical protein
MQAVMTWLFAIAAFFGAIALIEKHTITAIRTFKRLLREFQFSQKKREHIIYERRSAYMTATA